VRPPDVVTVAPLVITSDPATKNGDDSPAADLSNLSIGTSVRVATACQRGLLQRLAESVIE